MEKKEKRAKVANETGQCVRAENATESHVHGDISDPVQVGSNHRVCVEDTSGSRLLLTLILNFVIPVLQVIGGVYAGSTALISDATHNFSDFVAIMIACFAYRLGQKGASVRNTFGYRRAEIMAALLNVVILVGAVVFIVYEAFHRLLHPEAVLGQVVIALAAFGILGNGFSAWLLHRDSKHSLNVRGAFLHMLGDLFTSVAVLINGIILIFKPWYWLDPLLSILIVVFILKNCWSLLKEASAILMNATPKGLDVHQIKGFLEQVPGVCGVHYLHAWNLSSSSIAFSCHVEVRDQPVSQTEKLAEKIRQGLFHRFGIDHPILQFETARCGDGSMLCEISCGGASRTDN
jgi:cation diffusion facilitator family transporter